jgi:hypothetical protein
MAYIKNLKKIKESYIDDDTSMIYITMNDNTKIEITASWNKDFSDITIIDVFSTNEDEIVEQPFTEEELCEIIKMTANSILQ